MGRNSVSPKTGLNVGVWSREEDQLLTNYITRYGHWNWRLLPKYAGLSRCGKSCRLRWLNYLRPNIKRGNFTKEEEDLIISLHEKLGNRWSSIVPSLPGRTDNEIKNYWHTHLKKRYTQRKTLEEVKGRHKLLKHETSILRNSEDRLCEPHTLTPIILESSSLCGTSKQSSNDFTPAEGSVSPVAVNSQVSSEGIFDIYTNFWELPFLSSPSPFSPSPFEEASYFCNLDFSSNLWMN